MRIIALVLLAAMLFPAVAAVASPAVSACCCKTGAGASCPMKRTAASCAKPGSQTCGMQPAEARIPLAPSLPLQRPALIPVTVAATMNVAAAAHELRRFHCATRSTQRPEPPPPRRA
jgi:hypothetical protein